MIRRLSYNCDPESLADVSQADFAEAFENELTANPKFRECSVSVTFNVGHSRIESIAADDGTSTDPIDYADDIYEADKKAFRHCCESPA